MLHAPRQTGKTSALLALRDLLNGGAQGDFRCVYANVEAGQAMRENVAEGWCGTDGIGRCIPASVTTGMSAFLTPTPNAILSVCDRTDLPLHRSR